MTTEEFRAALRSLGLVEGNAGVHTLCDAAAKRWGMHARSIERRWYGELPVLPWMAHLIALENGKEKPLCERRK